MRHYALGVQYDGTEFSGFQRQANAPTVQGELEHALSSIAADPVSVTAAGRTDAGVHATQQVVSFSTNAERPNKAWERGTNSMLPNAIAVSWVREVPSSFNARLSAMWRRYLFLFGASKKRQVFVVNAATWIHDRLDVGLMSEAGTCFIGEQDFSSIRAAGCGSTTPYRHVYHLAVKQIAHLVVIDIAANAFLLHMVRNLAAVLHEVGKGKLAVEDVKSLLNKRDRTLAPPTAKPSGLYLVAVGYEPEFGIDDTMCVPAILGDAEGQFEPIDLPDDHYKRPSAT